jgi:hypothetical protein
LFAEWESTKSLLCHGGANKVARTASQVGHRGVDA